MTELDSIRGKIEGAEMVLVGLGEEFQCPASVRGYPCRKELFCCFGGNDFFHCKSAVEGRAAGNALRVCHEVAMWGRMRREAGTIVSGGQPIIGRNDGRFV